MHQKKNLYQYQPLRHKEAGMFSTPTSPISKMGTLATAIMAVLLIAHIVTNWNVLGPYVIGGGLIAAVTCTVVPVGFVFIALARTMLFKK